MKNESMTNAKSGNPVRNLTLQMTKNIKLNYVFTGLMNFSPTSALWVVYMASKGLSLGEIGIAEALLHITVFVMEVPTGVIADLFGRRISRFLGALLWMISTLLEVFASTFAGFCLAFVVTGIAITMESGAGEALAYDSLKAICLEDTYKKVAGKIITVINICEAVAILMGGLLSDIRFLYAYLASASIKFAAVLVSLTFTEPPFKREHEKRESFKGQLLSCADILKKNGRIVYIILLNGVLDMTACLVYFYGRKVFVDEGLSQGITGFIYMIYCLIGAVVALKIHRLDDKFGEKRIIIVMCLVLMLGFGSFSFGFGFIRIAAFFLIGFVYGATFPLFSDYINKEVPSEYRATILSLNGAMFSFSMIVFFPLVGILGDAVGLGRAFSIISVPVAVVLSLLALLTYRRGRVPEGRDVKPACENDSKIRTGDSSVSGLPVSKSDSKAGVDVI